MSCSKKIDIKIDDHFVDSSPDGTAGFAFVSVSDYNKQDIESFCKNYEENFKKSLKKDSLPVVLKIHVYKLKDTTSLSPALIEQIRTTHPDMIEKFNKLQSVKSGYIFRYVSHYMGSKFVEKDTLVRTTVILPKPGISAKEILK